MKYLIYASPFVGLFLILGTGPATVAQTYQDPPSLVKIPCSHARENHSSWVEKLSSPQLNCKLTQLRQIYWGGFYDSTFSPLAASSQEAQQIAQGCTPARSMAMKLMVILRCVPASPFTGQEGAMVLGHSRCFCHLFLLIVLSHSYFFICSLIQFLPFCTIFLYIFAPKLCLFGGPLDFPLPFSCPLAAQLHFFAFSFSLPRWRRVDTRGLCTS